MRQNPTSPTSRSRQSGFSLVELLTVIAIISVLMTVAVVGLNNMAGGKGVASAVSVSEAVFEEARSLAVGKRTSAAVLISVQDPQNRDTYLRRMVVAVKEIDPLTNEQKGGWVLASRGATLPDKVYFSSILSKRDHDAGSGSIDKISLSTSKREYSGEYYIYEFNSEGICTTPGASFVVGTGARSTGGSDTHPKVIGSAKRDFGGFVIYRNGNTSVFRDPSQILKSGDVTKF